AAGLLPRRLLQQGGQRRAGDAAEGPPGTVPVQHPTSSWLGGTVRGAPFSPPTLLSPRTASRSAAASGSSLRWSGRMLFTIASAWPPSANTPEGSSCTEPSYMIL